ncbi:D-amino-acid dehydrogenase [Pseudooceanicola batsensis HTCC2597]|uniref:D-amino-acid dehydrogenase n=2 Tax=Pseudooceanicola batsensis TaxID=314255 RepID=A3U1A5_PSEBH|nr:D-amino-acid dehydrogenase [Pseudooceanicola batsensis HTCC2597]
MTLARDADFWHVQENSGDRVTSKQAVIAMGMRSAELCKRFGLKVPLFPKRGYHLHLPAENGPRIPFVDVASSAVFAPMAGGLRVLTGAEIARDGSKTRPVQLERARRAAKELFEVGEPVEHEPWVGVRPCMPDMLPMIGEIPGQKGLWANFGHGHQGFTLGPTTASLLAGAMIDGIAVEQPLLPIRLLIRAGSP